MALKGLRDRLDKFIWIEKEVPAEEPAEKETPAASGVGRRYSSGAPGDVSGAPSVNEASVEGFLNILHEETEDDRSPGHRKFWDQLNVLKDVDMPEATRYKAAAKTASGVTAADLLGSIAAVLSEVDKEVAKFGQSLEAAEQQKVGEGKAQVESIDARLSDLEKQVAQLQSEKATLIQGISAAERTFVQRRADFAEAVRRFRQELEDERKNIQTHLGS